MDPCSQSSDNSHEIASSPSRSREMRPIMALMEEGFSPRLILSHIAPGIQISPEADDMMLWRTIMNILEPPRRRKIPIHNTLDDAIKLIDSSKNIIMLSGAGISTSAGIPDFRSRNGIYVQIHSQHPDLEDPKLVFDINYFKSNPLPFYKFAKALFPSQFQPTIGHKFIKCVEDQGKLLRNYTQNIDTLEKQTGIKNVIECHGSFAKVTCTSCGYSVDGETIKDDVFSQNIPKCLKCHEEGKKPIDGLGVLKPNIVFFGEPLGDNFHKSFDADQDKVDLLIVIGSSLKVRPVALIPKSIPANVPQILINREPLEDMNFDIELLGNCDDIIQELCLRLGGKWKDVCEKDIKPLNEIVGIPKSSVIDRSHGEKDDTVQSCCGTSSLPKQSDSKPIDQETNTNASVPTIAEVDMIEPMENKNNQVEEPNTEPILDNDDDDEDWDDVEVLDSPTSSESEFTNKVDFQVPEGSYIFVKPNVYLFKGVELTQSQLGDYTKDQWNIIEPKRRTE